MKGFESALSNLLDDVSIVTHWCRNRFSSSFPLTVPPPFPRPSFFSLRSPSRSTLIKASAGSVHKACFLLFGCCFSSSAGSTTPGATVILGAPSPASSSSSPWLTSESGERGRYEGPATDEASSSSSSSDVPSSLSLPSSSSSELSSSSPYTGPSSASPASLPLISGASMVKS